ncbi:MAG: DUF421 domain-containing protein [Peptococcaceae bacterium]|nr:DUF421 domain-containing protein [Peptococcaceae bacterium]
MDGSILEENLQGARIEKEVFMNQLRSYGINHVQEVFYAGMDPAGKLYISKKQDAPEQEGQYGIN